MRPFFTFIILAWLVAPMAVSGEDDVEGEEGYIDFIEELRRTPIDINSATMEDLMKLPGVSPSIAAGMIASRELSGGFSETNDLVRLGLVSEVLYHAIAPFVTVGQKEARPEERVSVRIRWVERRSVNEEVARQQGNYLRVDWERGERWRAGLLAERDLGERRVVDNWKWSLSYEEERGFIRQIVAGNLRYELSRGLLFFTRSRITKGSLVPGSAGRRGRGLGLDLSTTEGYILRGFGLELHPSPLLSVTALVSSTSLDVTRSESGTASAIRSTGYHLGSPTEDRGGIVLLTTSGHVDVMLGGRGNLGFTLLDLGYSEAVIPPPDEGNYHEFRGSRRDFLGVDWDLAVSGLGIFGEGGIELSRGSGLLLGVESGAGPARWSILFRDYSPDFAPPFGNPFQEGSGVPTNERGFYTGLAFHITPDIKLSLYIDAYRRRWRRSQEPFPGKERELFVEGRWRPKKGVQVTLRLSEASGEKAATGEIMSKNRERSTRKLRLQMEWGDGPLKFRGRYELSVSGWRNGEREYGDLLYFDSRIRPYDPLSIDLRVAFFESETITSTVYAYEIDLPGVMHVAPYTGSGMKWYVYGKYRLRENLSIHVKWSETEKYRMEDLESGRLDTVTDRRFGVQLDLGVVR